MTEFLGDGATVGTQDNYVPGTTLGPAAKVRQITLSVIGANPALIQCWRYTDPAHTKWDIEGIERLIVGNSIGVVLKNCAGVQIRSAIKGSPTTVVGELAYETDISLEGGGVTSAVISATGQTGSSGVLVPVLALSAFPPTNPADGQTVLLELPASYDPVGGLKIRWLCTYNQGTGMWDVAGAPLVAIDDAAYSVTAPTAYGDVPGGSIVAVAAPRAGDYVVEHGAELIDSNTSFEYFQSFQFGNVAAADNDAITNSGGSPQRQSGWIAREKTGLTQANPNITLKIKGSGSGAMSIARRVLKVTPIRIS